MTVWVYLKSDCLLDTCRNQADIIWFKVIPQPSPLKDEDTFMSSSYICIYAIFTKESTDVQVWDGLWTDQQVTVTCCNVPAEAGKKKTRVTKHVSGHELCKCFSRTEMCSKFKYMEAPQGTFNSSNLTSRSSVRNFCLVLEVVSSYFCSSISKPMWAAIALCQWHKVTCFGMSWKNLRKCSWYHC